MAILTSKNTYTLYQVDAFAEKVFEGNPAAVVPLQQWLPDELMQAIAAENNLAETAFFVEENGIYHIRWFTPVAEVKLCGHATLASAYVLFEFLGYEKSSISFMSLSGELSVSKQGELLSLDFPAQAAKPCELPQALSQGIYQGIDNKDLKQTVLGCYENEDYLVVLASEEDVLAIEPNHESLKQLKHRGVIVTAPSSDYDFVARFFAPKYGIDEDPVTGSAYTQLVPYWAEKMGKSKFTAKQVSKRGGKLWCELKGVRVLISGHAALYMKAEFSV